MHSAQCSALCIAWHACFAAQQAVQEQDCAPHPSCNPLQPSASLCIPQAAQEKSEREGRLREQAEKGRLRREAQEEAATSEAAAEAARRKSEAAEKARAAEAEAKVREQARAAAAAQSKLLGGGANAPGSPSLSAATDESLSQGLTDSDASAGW